MPSSKKVSPDRIPLILHIQCPMQCPLYVLYIVYILYILYILYWIKVF